MSESVIRAQLLENIETLKDDENLLSHCISICKDYNISGENFFYKWEALHFNSTNEARGVQPILRTISDAEDVKKGLIADLNKKKKAQEHQRRPDPLAVMRKNFSGLGRGKKPTAGRNFSRDVKAAPSVTFKGPTDESEKRRYRYMYEKVSERSEVLDERIDEFGELIRDHYNVDELCDPSSTSEEDFITVGRICNDAEASNSSAKLTEGSVFLESSRMMGSGARVPLRFSPTLKIRGGPQGASSVGLFPGAIVALKGRNGGGGMFVVEEILALPPLNVSPEPASYKGFTMAMACGPYTPDSDLNYTNFNAFMEKMSAQKPSVLVLLGPFIDASHPSVKSGNIDQMPLEIFYEKFGKLIRNFVEETPGSLVLLEPSIRDILSDHPVYPQCEFDNSLFADPRVKMIPNPCRFSINDVVFASTSVDVLLHLRNQEYAQRGIEIDPVVPLSPESSGTDLLTNTCRHLLYQRSFYPLFPVPADLSTDVNLDVSHLEGLRIDQNIDERAPDVLIVPSKLKQFTKLVDSTWAVNPSYLTKGTYALISVPDTSRAELRRAMQCEIMKL